MADKNFKVKTSITSPTPIAITEGGTGQTTANNALNAFLPLQTSNSGKYLTTDGTNTSWSTVSGSYVQVPSSTVSSNITLVKNNFYFVDTTAVRSLALPASPSVGDVVYIYDQTGSSATNNITVTPNGSNINGSAQNLIIDLAYAQAQLVYTSAGYGWRVYIS